MSDTFVPFQTKKYLAIAKEPVFVGTGGYRIGRVDNTIIRDAGTGIPKIPGSTISGNARYYSWLYYKSAGMNLNLGCAKGKKTEDEDACGVCPVCLTYGYINDNGAHSGLAYFSDARILFFPVSTMIGTVWITSDAIIKEFIEAGGDGTKLENLEDEKFITSHTLNSALPETSRQKVLNFGWIMLEYKDEVNPQLWRLKKIEDNEEIADLAKILQKIDYRICVVSQKVFYHIVNSNLETRTSVSINPVTGAAESGALFTYEALPRGTVFIMDITYENPKNYNLDEPIENVIYTVEKGLSLFSSLGIGGMGTRGFGKIEVETDKWLDEHKYWERVKDFLGNLPQKISELEVEIENSKISEEDKKQSVELKNHLCKKLRLWNKYLTALSKLSEEEIEKKKGIFDLIKDIPTDIPETCSKSEEGNNDSN